MALSDRIDAFCQLGIVINQVLVYDEDQINLSPSAEKLRQLIHTIQNQNPWFTPDNVKSALSAIAHTLSKESLSTWAGRYPLLTRKPDSRRIGVTLAGNIPLVGFHDFLSVLISGNRFVGNLSSKDDQLLPAIAHVLTDLQPGFNGYIDLIEGPFTTIDAIIATGSDNSARYFDYYFSKYPNIIRRNRNGIAILDGTESSSELQVLGEDIFQYFGLGCRSISKLFIPANYDFGPILKSLSAFKHVGDHKKYRNNYVYNRAKYLVQQIPIIDSGFVILKEDPEFASPPGVIFFEHYGEQKELIKRVNTAREKIQCIVSNNIQFDSVGFGKTQYPELSDYADGIDTMEFLLSLNNG